MSKYFCCGLCDIDVSEFDTETNYSNDEYNSEYNIESKPLQFINYEEIIIVELPKEDIINKNYYNYDDKKPIVKYSLSRLITLIIVIYMLNFDLMTICNKSDNNILNSNIMGYFINIFCVALLFIIFYPIF